MTKNDLEEIFKECEIPSNEGIQYLETNDKLPRIVYFEYRWEDIVASGKKFDTNVNYQVSFRSAITRDPKLLLLKKKLNEEIEMGCSYSQILKTSEDIDKLLAEYYLKDIKNIT